MNKKWNINAFFIWNYLSVVNVETWTIEQNHDFTQ